MKISHLFESEDTGLIDDVIASRYFQLNIAPFLDTTKDTDDILRDLRDHKRILHHGTKRELDVRNTMQERKRAKDSNPYAHHYVNKLAEKKFGVPVRNLMFVVDNHTLAKTYGNVGVVVPLGSYQLYYNSEVRDFTWATYSASTESTELDDRITVDLMKREIPDEPLWEELAQAYGDDVMKALIYVVGEIAMDLYESNIVPTMDTVEETFNRYSGAFSFSKEDEEYLVKSLYTLAMDYKKEQDIRYKEYVREMGVVDNGTLDPKETHGVELMLNCEEFALLSLATFQKAVVKYLSTQTTDEKI